MSEKVALSQAVAENVRRWRIGRGLDQQSLADRLASLGWAADRTTVTRIERGTRKVTVEDLGLLAVALNVPLPLLLLPVLTGDELALTADGTTTALHPWLAWEWMRGMEHLPGRLAGGEWRTGALPIWLYDAVRDAQIELQRLGLLHREDPLASPDYRIALQTLVDALADMSAAGLPIEGLAGDWQPQIDELGLTPSPRSGRRSTTQEDTR